MHQVALDVATLSLVVHPENPKEGSLLVDLCPLEHWVGGEEECSRGEKRSRSGQGVSPVGLASVEPALGVAMA